MLIFTLITVGFCEVNDQISAINHPINDHPKNKFNKNIGIELLWPRIKAIINGKKYNTTKIGNINNKPVSKSEFKLYPLIFIK